MDLHDLIVKELEQTKSLAALIYLIDHGRELEFSLYGKEYFISRDKSRKYVSFWENQNEQSFDSMEELIGSAVIANSPFISVWPEIQIGIIF